MSLLRTLLIIALIYFAIRFISRYIFPLVIKSAANKMQEDLLRKMDEMHKRENERNEGDISIKPNSQSKNRKNEGGEYVDYEEIK